MKFDYSVFKPILNVKRYIVRNPHTDFLQIHFLKDEKHFIVEKVESGKYVIEEQTGLIYRKYIVSNILRVDDERQRFFAS